MKKNVGSTDRYIRFLTGIALFVNIIVIKPELPGIILLTLGGLGLLATSYFSFCSLYIPFKISTIKDCQCGNGKANDIKDNG